MATKVIFREKKMRLVSESPLLPSYVRKKGIQYPIHIRKKILLNIKRKLKRKHLLLPGPSVHESLLNTTKNIFLKFTFVIQKTKTGSKKEVTDL